MNTPAYSNIYLCIDRHTKIVVWTKANWNGYPNLRITDPDILFVNFKNTKNIYATLEDFQKMEVVLAEDYDSDTAHKKTYILKKLNFEITSKQKEKLMLLRTKCTGIYSWLDGIYNYMARFNGILPGVYISANQYETNLLNDEQTKVKNLVSELINQYYDRLWLSSDEKEFYSCLSEVNKNTLFY